MGTPRSWASRSAIRFSKPPPLASENGRSFGSAQTRSSLGAAWTAGAQASSAAASLMLRQREDIEHPALGGDVRQVGGGTHEPERRRAVAHVKAAGHDGTGPAAHAGEDGHVLAAVGSAVDDRLADDP